MENICSQAVNIPDNFLTSFFSVKPRVLSAAVFGMSVRCAFFCGLAFQGCRRLACVFLAGVPVRLRVLLWFYGLAGFVMVVV